MTNQDRSIRGTDDLRRRAEEIAASRLPKVFEDMSENDMKALVHELQVNQIELEMQNEELKSARSQAQRMQEKYLDLYDFAPISYFTIDLQGVILTVNITGAKLLGTERNSLTGRRFQLFLEESSRSGFTSFLTDVIVTDEKQRFEADVLVNEGASIPVQIDVMASADPLTSEKQLKVAVFDITKRRQAERALRESEMNFQAIFDYTPAAIFAYDSNGMILQASPMCGQLFDIPSESLLNQSMYDTVLRSANRNVIDGVGRVFSGVSVENL